MSSKFGQLLLRSKLISEKQLEHALVYQKDHGGKLGEVLTRLGYITHDDVTRTLGTKYGVPTVSLVSVPVGQEVLDLLPWEMARNRRVVPVSRQESSLTCAMEDPTRFDVIKEIEFQTGFHVHPVLVTPEAMTEALDRYYPARGTKPGAGSAGAHSQAVQEIIRRLDRLPPEKLQYVRKFVEAIR